MREAALFLLRCTARNRARLVLRQMRSPRYIVALVLGFGYLGLVLFGPQHRPDGLLTPGGIQVGGTVLLLVMVAKWWVFGADRTALAFSFAEIQFFFPAPVSRPALLGYKLARSQMLILLNVAIWALLLRPGEPGVGLRPVNLWLLFSTISLHRLGVALTRQTAVEHGRAGLKRVVIPLVLVLGALGVVGAAFAGLEDGIFANDPLTAIGRAAETPPLAWLLWPFRLPLLPFTAGSLAEWLTRVGIAAGILALHLAWVMRADRAFAEASLEASAYRAELLRRLRGTSYQAPNPRSAPRRWFRLATSGHPSAAILWKSLTRLARSTSPGLLATIAAGGGVGLALGFLQRDQNPIILTIVGTLALTWCGILAVIGPLWVRADLRGDLNHLALLRTWPLSGLVVMTGQVLGSAVVLTAAEAVLAGVGLAAVSGVDGISLPAGLLIAGLPIALVALLGVNLLAVAIQNGGALLFPAWVGTEIRPGGVEAMGQQMLTAGVSLILLAFLLAGPAILAGGVFYFSGDRLGPWAMIPALMLGTAGLALEGWLMLDWLGDRFEQIDLSDR